MISTISSILSTTLPTLKFKTNTTLDFDTLDPLFNLSDNGQSNFTNSSSPVPVFPNYIRNISIVFCVLIMCLGVVGNVMVPIVILKTKDMRNSTNIFLMNLSLADLLVLLVCTPTVLVEVNSRPETWVLGEEMCKMVPFVELTVAHASVLTILAISFERYYAICEPLKAGYVCTKARASLICLLAWAFAALCTSPVLNIAEYSELEYHDGSLVPTCRSTANTMLPFLYFLFTNVFFFMFPLVILVVLYIIIARTLVVDAENLILNKHLDHYSLRARKQVVLMLGTVVLSFFLCLIPFRVFTLWIMFITEETFAGIKIEHYYNALYFCRIMVYLNSAVNPILYNLMSTKFRDAFLRVCCGNRGKFKRGFRQRNGTFSTTITSYRNSTVRQSSANFKTSRSQSLKNNDEFNIDRHCKESPNTFRSGLKGQNHQDQYTFKELKLIDEGIEQPQSPDVMIHNAKDKGKFYGLLNGNYSGIKEDNLLQKTLVVNNDVEKSQTSESFV